MAILGQRSAVAPDLDRDQPRRLAEAIAARIRPARRRWPGVIGSNGRRWRTQRSRALRAGADAGHHRRRAGRRRAARGHGEAHVRRQRRLAHGTAAQAGRRRGTTGPARGRVVAACRPYAPSWAAGTCAVCCRRCAVSPSSRAAPAWLPSAASSSLDDRPLAPGERSCQGPGVGDVDWPAGRRRGRRYAFGLAGGDPDQIDSGSCASSSSGRRCLGRGRIDQVLELTHRCPAVAHGQARQLVARPRWRHAGWTMPRDHVGDQRRAMLLDRRRAVTAR